MRVLFRADATLSSGAGHVMRCWALAEEMAQLGARVAWHGRIEVPWVHGALGGMRWSVQTPYGSPADQARQVEADLVVVDSYTLDDAYREELVARGIPVVVITDESVPYVGSATLWVNPGAPLDLSLPEGVPSLTGPDYVLIRRAVRELRLAREEGLRSGDIEGLTLMLGGTDFGRLASTIHRLEISHPRVGAVFAGPGSRSAEGTITWIEGGEELLRKAALAHLVVSAAGVSSWELAHIGVPMALVQVARNQAGNYRWMTQQGWAWPLGNMNRESPQSLGAQVRCALDALEGGMLEGRTRIDGLGARRVAQAAVSLL